MQIEAKLLKKWVFLRSPEDVKTIAEKVGVSGQLVRNAYRTGKCSARVFKALAELYTEREKEIKEVLQSEPAKA